MSKVSFFVSCLFLFAAIFTVHFLLSRPNVVVVNKGFDKIPMTFGGYSGKNIVLAGNVVSELDADVYVFRNYSDRKRTIALYLGYYGTAKGGRTGHNPNACYPSSGFAILDESKVLLTIQFQNRNPREVVITRLLITKNDEKQLVYHWYQSSGDQILVDGIEQNLHRFKTRMLYNRNDGAFVRVSAAVEKNISDIEDNLLVFIRKLIPMIEQYWPTEREESDEL